MINLEAELRAMGTSNTVPDVEQMDALLIRAADEIKGNRAALKVAQQSLLEFSHAQECGSSWYSHGERGMYRQVSLWLQRGLKAVQDALGPYDDNGQYLKEMTGAEPSGGLSIRYPGDEQKCYIHPWSEFESIVFQPNWRTARIWKEGDNLCFIAGPAEKSTPKPEQLPINRALVRALDFSVIPLLEGSVQVENRSPDPVVITVDRAGTRP